jgi:transcriptional regulator NrdR family protein
MHLFQRKRNICDECNKKFSHYEELVEHARHIHHKVITKCDGCGKQFVHEKDRLHHVREEHDKKVDYRTHKSEHAHKKKTPSIQDQVDEKNRKFSDNF